MSSLCRLFPPKVEIKAFVNLSLYLVANKPSFEDVDTFFERVNRAVMGGISCVQYRDFESDFHQVQEIARQLKRITQDTPLYINTQHTKDRLGQILKTSGADGIFLEHATFDPTLREQLGETVTIGTSVRSMSEVQFHNESQVVDYLSVKVAASKRTCPHNDHLWGLDGLEKVIARSVLPIVAIGGLQPECAENVYQKLRLDRKDGIAMAGGIMNEEHPDETVKKVLAIRQKVWEERCL